MTKNIFHVVSYMGDMCSGDTLEEALDLAMIEDWDERVPECRRIRATDACAARLGFGEWVDEDWAEVTQ